MTLTLPRHLSILFTRKIRLVRKFAFSFATTLVKNRGDGKFRTEPRLCRNVILSPFDTLRINSGEESRLRKTLKMRDASLCSA